MKYRTTLTENQINMVRTQWQNQIKKEGFCNKQWIGKMLLEEFPNLWSVDAVRHKVGYLITQFEEEFDRPNSMNDFAEDERMVGMNIMSWWIHKYDENGKKVGTYNVKNPHYTEEQEGWRDLIENTILSYKFVPKEFSTREVTNKLMLRVIITDAHVGLKCDMEDTLFSFEYNGELFRKWLEKTLDWIIQKHKLYWTFDELRLDDLWDSLDGYDWLTTRGWHKLDQNMSNREAYRTFVHWKLWLIEEIIKLWIANKIVIHNVCNDNHSGDFGYVANYSIYLAASRIYGEDKIQFHQIIRPIEHFKYGEHTFMLLHWKDIKQMKYPFPYKLNDKTIININKYMDFYGIENAYVDKWDTHLEWFDASQPNFIYRNYPPFSPPSAYIQVNYGYSRSAAIIELYNHDMRGRMDYTPIYLHYEKKWL